MEPNDLKLNGTKKSIHCDYVGYETLVKAKENFFENSMQYSERIC